PGRKSAISSALTHTAEPVLFLTSTTSATTAIQVPRPEISVEPKRSLKLGDARRIAPWRERITGKRTGATLARGDAAYPGKRVREEAVLLERARGDADRRRRPEAVQRTDDHPFLEQGLEQLPRVGAGVRVHEVRDRRPGGLVSQLAQQSVELGHRLGIRPSASLDLRWLVEARECSGLGGARHVERALDLVGRCDYLLRRDHVTDPQPGQAVDLREGT